MGRTIAQKIIASYLLSGDMTPGTEIGLRIGQTLTQDATGTRACLALENIHAGLRAGKIIAAAGGSGKPLAFTCPLSERQISSLLAGGLLNHTREAGL